MVCNAVASRLQCLWTVLESLAACLRPSALQHVILQWSASHLTTTGYADDARQGTSDAMHPG
jgi:hypothetical protein